MQLGEVIFGGVGSGLYGMLAFVIIAVFVAGLMVGRTPEYLGKKIETFEMKMASLIVLIPVVLVLVGDGIGCSAPRRESGCIQPRSARLQRGALRLFFGRQQQRQCFCGPGIQQFVLQHRLGISHAGRSLLVDHPHPGDCRIPGAEEKSAFQRGNTAHTHALVHRLVDWSYHHCRCVELFPGVGV